MKKTAALVAFYLLASAATAYAECARVWRDGQLPRSGLDTVWSIVGTYSTAKGATQIC